MVKQGRKRRTGGKSPPPPRAAYPKHVWSDDFVHAEPHAGRRLQCLTVLDEYTREGLVIHGARSITAADVLPVLQRLLAPRGTPTYVKSANGPEVIAQQVTTWLGAQHVAPHVVAPGSPWQNGHDESVNGVFRDGCLNRWLFPSVQEARRIIHPWLEEYNHERPQGALDGLTPAACAAQHRALLEEAA